jgi:hypothetical protein
MKTGKAARPKMVTRKWRDYAAVSVAIHNPENYDPSTDGEAIQIK